MATKKSQPRGKIALDSEFFVVVFLLTPLGKCAEIAKQKVW